MTACDFDLIVLGSGPAASTVADDAADQDKRFAVIESREFGGTCALRGCNPKKVYTNAGQLVDQVRHANGSLVDCPAINIDWSQLLAFKRQFTEPVLEKKEESLRRKGATTIQGCPRFVDPQTILVNDRKLTAERFFLGVGGKPVPLQIEGAQEVLLSDEFLELQSLPEHVTFIGGGYISMEFAGVVAQFGSQVVVIERGDAPLEEFDPDLVQQLVQWYTANGIQVICQAEVHKIKRAGGSLELTYQRGGKMHLIQTDMVIHGAGRVPNLDGLDLDAGNVRADDTGVHVNQWMQSISNPAVFAAGDCAATGKPQLTSVANEEARSASKNIFAEPPTHTPDYGAIPAVAFTSPPLATVGLSESDAKDRHGNVDVRYEDTSTWGSVRKTGLTCSGYKVLVDRHSDRIVGAHLIGPSADETINLFTLAIKFGLTATDLKSTLFAFPTFASDVRRMV